MKTRILMGFLALILLPCLSFAGPIGFAISTSELYLVDFATSTATLIGSTGALDQLEGLALSPDGKLYATDATGNLYSIDTTTGAGTLIGDTDRGDIEGLDFLGNTLVGTDFDPFRVTLFSIDTTTAATSNIITSTSTTYPGAVRTMAVLDSNTVLVRGDLPVNNTLYQMNLTTGVLTQIGVLNFGTTETQFAAMDFLSDGKLYGLGNSGNAYLINPANAGVTVLGNTGGQFWFDLTGAPIPEPTSLFLLGTGLGALGLVAWRKRK